MDKKTEVDWQNFATKLEAEFSNDIFHCNDSYEMLYIKKLLKKEMPEISDTRIEYVLEQCCTIIPAPRTIKDLTKCLKNLLS